MVAIARRTALGLGPAAWAAGLAAAPPIRRAFVFEATPEHPRNDTANVLELRDGSLLAVWHKYYASKHGLTDFGMARIHARVSRDGGASWVDDRMLVDNESGDNNVQAPGLCRARDGSILLNCLRGHARNSSSMIVFRSTDEGRTFQEHSRVWQRSTGQWLQGGASGMVVLASGRILLPFHFGNGDQGSQHNMASCFRSEDDGRTWKRARGVVDLPMRGAMEASVAQLGDGSLAMSLRTQLGSVFLCRSEDEGDTWSLPQTTGLRAPESCTCLRRVPGTDRLVLLWNDAEYDPKYDHFGKRTPLAAAVSYDGGATWRRIGNIESGDGEFTNINCTFLKNGSAVVTYFRSGSVRPRTRVDLMSAVIDGSWFASH